MLRNSRARLGQSFFAMAIFISAWAITNYFTDYATTLRWNITFNRLAYIFAFLALAATAFFTYYFAQYQQRRPKALMTLFFSGLGLISLWSATNYVAGTVTQEGSKLAFHTGPEILIYLVILLILLGAVIWNIWHVIKHGTSTQRNQAWIILASFTTCICLAILTNLIIPALSNNNFEAAKFGPPLLTLLLTTSITYAIVARRLFDIRLVVARSFAYVLLLATLSVIYSFAAFAVGGVFFKNSSQGIVQESYDVAIALILAYSFQSLKSFFQKATDDIFYRDHYDSATLLNNLGGTMSREIQLDNLTRKVINELILQMKLAKALIVVLDEDKIFYEANTESIENQTIGLEELHPLNKAAVVKDNLEAGATPELFDKYNLRVGIPLYSSNELVGYLLLGEKKSGDIFNSSDIKTLRILADELAIAIHNAKSYTQIQNFNKTLQRRVDEATKQLRDANEHLQKLDEIKNEFLSMATHQLNTPLNVVDGYLGMIIDNANTGNDLPKADREFIQKAMHRIHLMKRLVTDFLNVSRIEVGTFTIETTPVDMSRIVTEEVNGLGLAAKEHNVLLQYFPPKQHVPIIEIDEQKTRQAVMNLIDNAIYYAPKGEVKVYLNSDRQNIIFKVIDNGIGVPEVYKAKLFEKFSRADNAKKQRPSGTGVGLFLVKKVIEDQSGQIIFESTEGKGSTFGFTLPIKSKDEEPSKTPDSGPKLATVA